MYKFLRIVLTFGFLLAGCSANIKQPATPTLEPLPTPVASNTPAPQSATIASAYPTTTIPVTWADSKLTGRLVYMDATQDANGNPLFSIDMLDLVTGNIAQLFKATDDLAWIYYMSVSPDGKQIIMSYSVPAPNHGSVNQNLYILPVDGSSTPQMLVTPSTQYDQYAQEEWSPDGKYIYYVYFSEQAQSQDQHYPHYEIFRMAYPNGQPQQVADQAFWPRSSADGSRLVYVSMDPLTGKNKLFIANADGSNVQPVVLSGAWTPDIIDAPIFSSDGQSILFSALSPQQTSEPTWLEKLFGVQVAEAHMIPSDWFSVPITGGSVTRLTTLRTTALFASYSPDQQHIASYSGNGLFVMNPDGTNLTMLIPDMGGVPGVVNWLP